MTTITATAIINAQDKTGTAFAAIGKKIDGLSKSFGRVGAASKSVGNIGTNFRGVERQIDGVNRSLRNAHATTSMMGRVRGAIGAGAMLGVGAGGAFAAMRAVEAVAKASAAFQHETVRMATSGMSPKEIDEATKAALTLSANNRAVGQTEVMHMLRNARTIVGSYEEAAKIMDPLLKLRTVALGAHPEHAEELSSDFDKLIKSMEMKGVTQDLPKFTSYMEGMAKALNVFGDTLRPTDFYETFKYGRQATQALSQKFMLETAPTLAQEIGGSGAGTAMATFYGTIIGGKMKNVAAQELAKYGLLDESKIVRTKTGSVKGLSPGAVVGARLAASDPFAWINEVFLPALAKKGVTDKDKIQDIIATIFRDRTAAQMVGIFATQQQRIYKDWAMVQGAGGLSAAATFGQKDPMIAWQAVKAQFFNLFSNLESQVGAMAYTARVLGGIAKGEANVAQTIATEMEHRRAIKEAYERGLAPPVPEQHGAPAGPKGPTDLFGKPIPPKETPEQARLRGVYDRERLQRRQAGESAEAILNVLDEDIFGKSVEGPKRRAFAHATLTAEERQRIAVMQADFEAMRIAAVPVWPPFGPGPGFGGAFPGGAAGMKLMRGSPWRGRGKGRPSADWGGGSIGPSPAWPGIVPAAPVKAELTGTADVKGEATIRVVADDGLVKAVSDRVVMTIGGTLRARAEASNGPGSTGRSSPDAASPAGRGDFAGSH